MKMPSFEIDYEDLAKQIKEVNRQKVDLPTVQEFMEMTQKQIIQQSPTSELLTI